MTTTDPPPETLPALGHPNLWHKLLRWLKPRAFELPLVLTIFTLLVFDRYTIARQYLFKYTDEDQTCMWYAAWDLLHNGRIAEPSFYGQDYNCCLEGFLAVPLVACGMPYHVACPLVTLILGLLPFLLLAFVAFRRNHFFTAAAILLIPMLLPVRYAMIAGIPRGFINGIAVASIPAILLLPSPKTPPPAPPPDLLEPAPPPPPPKRFRRLRSLLTPLRFFIAGFFALAAIQVNPNCALLLGPLALYAMITRFFQWRFWVFGILGLLAAIPYPWYVRHFYYSTHTDYVLYLRDVHYQWGSSFFHSYLKFIAPPTAPSPVFSDLVPIPVSGNFAPTFLIIIAVSIIAYMLLKLRVTGLVAALVAIGLTIASFAFERVRTGVASNTASYPYSRMYLALPVVFAWLLFLANHRPWWGRRWIPYERYSRWITATSLVILCAAGIYFFTIRRTLIPKAIDFEVRAPGFVVCPAIPVAQFYATAREIQKVAAAEHADLLLVGGGDRQKHLAYAIPALLNIETLYPNFERRTHRLHEEYAAKHDHVLLIQIGSARTRVGGGIAVFMDADDNPVDDPSHARRTFVIPSIYKVSPNGRTIYDSPELRPYLPTFFTPKPTPEQPNPTPQVYRPPWPFR